MARTDCRYLAAIDWCRCRGFGCLEAESHRSSASYALWPNVIGRPKSSLSASHLNRLTLVSHDRALAAVSRQMDIKPPIRLGDA